VSILAKFFSAFLFFQSPGDAIRVLTFAEEPGLCTAFSVNAAKAVWLTASHCYKEDLTIMLGEEYRVMKVPYRDEGDDGLMVLVTDPRTGAGIPALKLGPRPQSEDPVILRGFGGSYFQRQDGRFIADNVTGNVSDTPIMLFTAHGMPGMSGGPVLDKDGKVVSVILGGFQPGPMGFEILSYGTPYDHLKEVLDKYAK